jgi:hypothetical protein
LCSSPGNPISGSADTGVALAEPPTTIGGVEATSVNEYDVAESRWITRFTFRRGSEVHRGTSVQHLPRSGDSCRRPVGGSDVAT